MARSIKPGLTPDVGDVIESIEHEAFAGAIDIPTPAPEASVENKPAPTKKTADEDHGGFFVYIGPSILGVIQSGAIFTDCNAAAIKAAITKYPLVKKLLIPGRRLAVDRVKTKTPGNSLYENYRELAAQVKSK